MTVALAICGSNLAGTTAYSCALLADGTLTEACTPPGDRGDLAVLVAELFARRAVRPEHLRELRVDLGPGSYTGLRVALTFARTLATLDAIRLLGIDSLTLLAAAAPPDATRMTPVLDARRERWHCGWFARGADGAIHQTAESRALTAEELLAAHAADHVVVAVPDQLDRVGALFAGLATAPRVVAALPKSAAALFDPSLPCSPLRAEELQPRYLMGSYAES
ncbi:MAG: tRNA threonylcarbamoyladenosine biosynthesis protein TsaB [Planctomycetota bacterium]